jgi:hypothetical protein
MCETRQGRCTMQGRVYAQWKARQMREAKPGSCARQGRAVELGKAGQLRRQDWEDARGKKGQILEARQGRVGQMG